MGMQALFTEKQATLDGSDKETQNNGWKNRVPMFGKCWMIKGLYDYEQFKNVQKDIKGRQKIKINPKIKTKSPQQLPKHN